MSPKSVPTERPPEPTRSPHIRVASSPERRMEEEGAQVLELPGTKGRVPAIPIRKTTLKIRGFPAAVASFPGAVRGKLTLPQRQVLPSRPLED